MRQVEGGREGRRGDRWRERQHMQVHGGIKMGGRLQGGREGRGAGRTGRAVRPPYCSCGRVDGRALRLRQCLR